MNPKLKRILRYIAIFMTIVWMIVIFRFSMDDGNSSHELIRFMCKINQSFNLSVYGKRFNDDYCSRTLFND